MPDPPNRTDPTVHLPQIDGALLEIRAAEGGLDAGVWAFDLLQMYRAFAERQGWQPAVWQLRNWGGAPSVAVSAVAEVVIALESEDAYLLLAAELFAHVSADLGAHGLAEVNVQACSASRDFALDLGYVVGGE